MIAYVFWHRAREGVDAQAYERAAERFHRSLAHVPPVGFRGSVLLRIGSAPWLEGEGWYEDWHLLHDFAALGVLNEAAVSAGHRGAHDGIARLYERGHGAVYKLIEGSSTCITLPLAVWVGRPAGAAALPLGEMLGDGAEPQRACLWRRALVLGPAPEYCVIADEAPKGAAMTRLPHGWETSVSRRDVIFAG